MPSDVYIFLKQCVFSFETKCRLDSFKDTPEGYETVWCLLG